MDKEEIKVWVKENKKKFAEDFLKNFPNKKDGKSVAFFMAGLPGAGKTEFSKRFAEFVGTQNIVRLDMDEIAMHIPGYTPEKADIFRGGASELLNRIFDIVLKRRLNFILDGTFGAKYALDNTRRAKEIGYDVQIFWVKKEPEIAWKFTKEREKIEHRSISKEGFVEIFPKISQNIISAMKKYDKISVVIVEKNAKSGAIRQVSLKEMIEIDTEESKKYNVQSLLEKING